MLTLQGRCALVTGGSRGIGRAVCVLFGRLGARVAVHYARDEAAANETVAAGIGPMSRPSAELIGACIAKPAPTARVRAMAIPRSIAPTLQTHPPTTPHD